MAETIIRFPTDPQKALDERRIAEQWANFDNFICPGSWRWFTEEKVQPGERRLFRFYHPEVRKRMAELRGSRR